MKPSRSRGQRAQHRSSWGDERIEKVVGTLLLAGVVASAAVVLAGGIVYLVRHGGESTDYRVFHGPSPALSNASVMLRDALELSGRGLIQVGLLLLIATPVARVLFSLVGFAFERDRIYAGVTAIVLAILLYGLFWGGPS